MRIPPSQVTDYWSKPPPQPSEKLLYWQKRFAEGFRPNRRIRSLGYHSAAEWYGVYIWEYLNIICKLDEQT